MKKVLLLGFGHLAVALQATAQTDTNPDAEARDVLEQIVVTAQKRSENLQDIPIAITALTSQQLDRYRIESPMDLTYATPGLNFSQTAVFAQPYIRGVGTDSFAPGNEASVATYVDGVYIASMNAAIFGLNDVERIEVLKGPQGTLYGRNTTGGLVNIVTRTPTQDLQLETNASYGNFGRIGAQAYAAGGLTSNVTADLAVSYSHQDDGYYRNTASGNRIVFEDGTYLRTKVVAELGEHSRLTVAGDYSDFRNTLANTRQPAVGSIPALPAGSYSTVPGRYANTQDDVGDVEDWGVSANYAVDFDALRFVSITAYRDTAGDQYLDSDDSALPISETPTHQEYEQFTQELQILSPAGAPFEWIAGLFYLDADAGWDPVDVYANGVRVNSAVLYSASTSIAGFGQATFDVGERGSFTLGGRYTYDKKDYRRSFAPGADVDASWERPTWRVAYDHRLSEQTLGYVSYNRGYKSGVYNTLFGPAVAVDPEIVDSYEIGLKNDLLDRRLRVNLATYYTEFKDIQVRSQQPGNAAVTLQNAAEAEIYGVDGEIAAVLSERLQLQVGFSWIHGEYTQFDRAEIYVPRPTGGNLLTIGDASGNPLPRAAELSGNIGLTYNHLLAEKARVYGGANYYYTDDIPWEPSGRVVTDAYGVLNGTLGYTLPGGRYSIEVYGRNLTDERYANYVVPSANADRTSYAPPRTYGVRFSATY